MKPLTEAHLAIFRRHMVEMIDVHYDLASDETGESALPPALRQALLDVPRHLFVPPALAAAAYQDSPLPIGFDKTISQPFIGALMLDLLQLEPGAKVLEIGTGYGYQAAVMAEMGMRVYSVEVVEEFAEAASARFAALGYRIEVRVGDGSRGWAENAPYDAILITAAAETVPAALFDQLKPGGRIVAPLGGKDIQQLTVVEKNAAGEAVDDPIMLVRFTQLEAAA